MDLIDCYLSTSRVALLAKCTDPSTWQEMHVLLPNLREHLSCRVCHKLLDWPYTHSDGYACMACSNGQKCEDVSSSIIQCYKKLCTYIQKSQLYDIMCTRDEDSKLVELLTEAIGVPRPINNHNGCLINDSVNKQTTEEANSPKNIELNLSSDVQLPIENKSSNDFMSLKVLDVHTLNSRIQNKPTRAIPKKKKTERRLGCRCGNATSTPGKLTCFGQRCPCYTEQKPCDQCKCRGCRNPRPKPNNDDNLEVDKIRCKPVTLELVPSLKPSHFNGKPAFWSYTMHDMLQFPSHSQNYEQGGAEVTLGHVNSIFHSP